jgi:hypothetical protein
VLDKLTPDSRKEVSTVPYRPRQLSRIMKEMAETLLRDPCNVPSSEAVHIALFVAKVAWNESVGLDNSRESYRNVWETLEAENPAFWNEFKWNDIDRMIDELVWHKKAHYPHDRRRILTWGVLDAKVRVEGLPPVAPGVDSKWEMRLYGLVRAGKEGKATRFLLNTQRISTKGAAERVAQIAVELGIG